MLTNILLKVQSWKNIVHASSKLCKIGFSVKCFGAYFLQFSSESVKIFILGSQLGTCL